MKTQFQKVFQKKNTEKSFKKITSNFQNNKELQMRLFLSMCQVIIFKKKIWETNSQTPVF
jgi:hypothetical protein